MEQRRQRARVVEGCVQFRGFLGEPERAREVAGGLGGWGGPEERVDLLGGHNAAAQKSHAMFDLGPCAVGSARGGERAPERDVGES